MLIHQLPLDAAFATLRSAPAGLSSAEAAARRVEFAPNRIERLPGTPLVIRFISQFTHVFAVLLWVAALLALVADWWMPGQGMATLGVAIGAVIVINGAFSFWQEYRAEETMVALQRLLPHQVRALRNGTTIVIPSEDVVPGDVIIMVTGDHPHTALAIAREIGLVQSATATLLTGDDLGRMSDTQVQLALDAPEIVCARVSADCTVKRRPRA
jgi:magnesium-transporting ATPase (P-type)